MSLVDDGKHILLYSYNNNRKTILLYLIESSVSTKSYKIQEIKEIKNVYSQGKLQFKHTGYSLSPRAKAAKYLVSSGYV